MLSVVCYVLRFIAGCRKSNKLCDITMEEKVHARNVIFQLVQEKYLSQELKMIKQKPESSKEEAKRLKILDLDPFVSADDNLMRVGGRLKYAIENNLKFPIILPKESAISRRIIEYYHDQFKHAGRTTTISAVRDAELWIININQLTSSVIYICVKCRILRGNFSIQKMADLSEDRVSCEAPFVNTGMDLFGHFITKEGRKEHKRYGIIFTCLSSRSVHLEMCKEMTTDSFISALRRFMARRGFVKMLRCDNGSNFVLAEKELFVMYRSLDHSQIRAFLSEENCNYIEWRYNAPYASHTGGVWERLIRSVKNVLKSCLNEVVGRVDDEDLQTFLCEAEAIINSRPLAM